MKNDLYRHFDADGKLLYVGISLSAINRLGQHKDNSHWYSKISRVDIEKFDSREEVVAAERKAIKEENPAHNISRPKQVDAINRYQESKDDIIKRTVNFNATYTLDRAASILNTSLPAIKRYIDNNELSAIVISEKKVGDKIQKKRIITGWQLIDFIEYLESSQLRSK